MKVKILTDGGYDGMGKAVGSVVEAFENEEDIVRVLGQSLIDAGACPIDFGADFPYSFFLPSEAEIVED